MADQFDLVVVGGGPGGYASAFYGASAGLNVALIEKDTLGGTCLNRGCIPAKAFLETAAARRHVQHAGDFGISATLGETDFAIAQARKQKIVDGLVKGLTGLVKSKKVTYFLGVGTLNDDKSVTVTAGDGTVTQLNGKNVVLAAGSIPRVIPGFEPTGTCDDI
jgi:dihydrolipoamide dehydrogenase